jgi:DNA topoisomerase IB
LSEHVDDFRKKWVKDLSNPDPKTQAMAAMVEIIYLTQARIGGSSTNKEGEDRFGLSTLLVKHVKKTPKGMKFDYTGKKSTAQHHELVGNSPTTRKVMSIISELTSGKKPDDLVFTIHGKRILGSMVNRYLRSLGVPKGITVHKFRHTAGTQLALNILKKSPFKKSEHPAQTAVEKWVKEEMKAVGEILHHRTGTGDKQKVTGMTAINAYISPEVLKSFFNNLGLRTPKWVPKL